MDSREELTEIESGGRGADRLRERIRRHGPVPFSAFMQYALYDPDGGFYATGGAAGRRGDFITSPEVGPLFGAVIARALDAWWVAAGRPAPFVVVDAGAGPGTLARSVLAAAPQCATALRYVLVEVSAAQRSRHAGHLPIEPAVAAAIGHAGEPDTDGPTVAAPPGPVVVSLAELPAVPVHVIIANELLDNLPVDIVAWDGERWSEVLVGVDGEEFVEVLVPAADVLAQWAGEFVPEPAPGDRLPVQRAAQRWLADALDLLAPLGRLVVIDYTATTLELSARRWLRTYRGHDRGGEPLDDPGSQDLTVDVDIDQLARVQPPTAVHTQTDFLNAHGMVVLVDEGRRAWKRRAHVGDLAALAARSRISEAEALYDPSGLGGFTVLEWVAPP